MVPLYFLKGEIDMPQRKSKFKYDGPVYKCGKYICNWKGITWAVSESKALANLSFRYKTLNNLVPGTKIELDPDYLSEATAVDESFEQYHQMTIEEVFG